MIKRNRHKKHTAMVVALSLAGLVLAGFVGSGLLRRMANGYDPETGEQTDTPAD